MKKITKNTLYLALLLFLTTACYEDKGNYDYSEVPEITAEGLPEQVTLLQKADVLSIAPTLKSSTEGIIREGDPNYEFGCLLYIRSGRLPNGSRYIDINEERKQKIECIPDVGPGEYVCWYTVTDKRTSVTTNFKVDVKIVSTTYEGWMVLCDEGAENHVRLDLISVISKDRIVVARDLLGMNAPLLRNAKKIYFDAYPKDVRGDAIFISSEEGIYEIDNASLETSDRNDISCSLFLKALEDEKPDVIASVYFNNQFVITDKGNLYKRNTWNAGGGFEFPINTLISNGKPEFTLAPFIGTMQTHNAETELIALLYDKDNRRFLKWDDAKEELCASFSDPENALFSFSTGKEMIAMESTKFASATVYSILQDEAHKRYVYGINLAGKSYQQTYYRQIEATDFGKAKHFAFHSLYPYMFYETGNKVYCYHLQGQGLIPSATLTLDGEEITMMKFNPFQTPAERLSDTSDEFLEQERYLIVGSYKKDDSDPNNGIVRFYKFDNTNGTLTEVAKYTGFAKVRDVTYRERWK
ncbi:PKD-like family lipoprotein [Bacteroides acidifaciens]|jgi:hypothetical protein|uniref:DUF5018 domain-containing protein n=1 Tax=Bacteroides acidifaciens TaxID=85831 RepID=A0A7J0A400_9BACE|nr:PKD-like family lipoprotein [Bacteroides acidifaciens]MBF0729884.1 hypothetical protein [Bacteroides acidifaciens]MBF0837611.1 hypothetical protein [Bacteroides acidifaciens]NDO56023.1 hypothetical protein [Bacteroides acidifaciens]TFU49390.1 hypothetical protein E4T97_10145 [Bacteroides acidifaciens]GFH87098.1 hypothetical protein IMSAGC001_02522 [Bacteroides acidifaciens]